MHWLAAIAIMSACSTPRTSQDHAGSAATGSGSAAAGTDPWAEPRPRGSDHAPPSLLERAQRASKLCPTVTPYFFEVAKEGKISHLLGTRHVGVPLDRFPQVVRTTIEAAKLAVFEVAPDDPSSRRSKEEPLRDQLGAADWAHLRELVGDDMAAMLEHAPSVTAVITMLVLFEDTTNLLDKQIEDLVAKRHIPARGLETAAFQDDILDRLLDFRMLRAEIEQTKDRAELEHDTADDLAQYCAGTDDSPGIDDKERAKMHRAGYSDAELAAMDDTLVYARNRAWIPKLEKLFEQPGVFVAVGADHLIGKPGVVSLLRARGFTITRIAN